MDNTKIDQTLEHFNTALKELIATAGQPATQEIIGHVDFRAKKGESNSGKGMIWSGDGPTKQLVYMIKPDRFFVSESVDLGKDKLISIGGVKVLDSTSIGPTVVKSNLREVGRLKGLIVDGSVSINQYFYYNGTYDRLGLGTETPNAALGVADRGVEVVVGTSDKLHGMVGTHAMTNFDIVTGNTARISIKANGNIDLGNSTQNPIQVAVHGKLSVGVATPDSSVDLHVAGPVRLNNKLQLSASATPSAGNYNIGDIVWNDAPKVGKCIGWVCVSAGSPGTWYPFGEIKEQNK
jgi:hypothetical protein